MEYYNDYFSSDLNYYKWTLWREEANRWLECFYETDPVAYLKSRKRVLRPNERDGFMAEIKTLYFLKKRLKLVINEIEPKDGLHDMSLTDQNDVIWNVEIKAPKWMGQVMRSDDIPMETRRERIKRDKYINAEGEWFNSYEQIQYTLEHPVNKALHKFNPSENNLLVICPDLKHSIHTMLAVEAMQEKDPAELLRHLIEIFDPENKISCVLLLETHLVADANQIEYDFIVCPISKSLQFQFQA